ncbi:uncharacterized protein LOC135309362 [Passer domesticus]|uniref:uncharacterized protein LOC135309362 n=1 Tax=Passer domesticus TaxID=48849 RepID=UPI0030FF1144
MEHPCPLFSGRCSGSFCAFSAETGSSAAEGPAEPDSGLTELQAEPDVSLDSAELSQDLDTTIYEDGENGDEALAQVVAITNAKSRGTEATTNTCTMPIPTVIHAATMEFFEESAVPSQQQVPAIVRNIHQRLLSHDTVDARLQTDIVRLAEEHPPDVVLTLLRCAPTCDGAAAIMWRAIASSRLTMEKVLPTLVRVMEDWPLSKMCTSDGDNQDVFALAATLVIWVIVQVPEWREGILPHSSRLFVALLFHIVITTKRMPPAEAGHFWKACREEHRLTINPSRFAVQTMKAQLYRLQCDNVVMAVERKRGWDTLLCAHTQHYAVGLLASCEKPRWDLPFLAFLVEVSLVASTASRSCLPALCPLVLECLDWNKCAHTVLKIMSSCLHSKCREQRRLALRGLVVLSKDPLMPSMASQLSLVFNTGQTYTQRVSKTSGAAG